MPQDTDYFLDHIENHSGANRGEHFGLCYIPEFVALGNIIKNMQEPEYVLVGAYDDKSWEVARLFYLKYLKNLPPVVRLTIPEAELAKIMLNVYMTVKINFANTIAGLCENLPNTNVDHITQALALDSRISGKYFKGGLGYSGPCFPRDVDALCYMTEQLGVPNSQIFGTKLDNNLICARIEALLPENKVVSVLGAAFKPSTDYIKVSPGIDIIDIALAKGNKVLVYDPMAQQKLYHKYGFLIWYYNEVIDCIRDADVVVVTTPDPAWRRLQQGDFKDDALIIDCWRVLDQSIDCWRLGEWNGQCNYSNND
jgi:UDPglucose 6-dehydrogenase